MHSGTTEAKKMLLWLSLWQQILWAASTCVLVPEVADRSFLEPDADIVAMARAYLPSEAQSGQQTFLRKLRERRSEIVEIWQAIPELSRWAELAKRWG
jgi:hypothetical protein